MGAVVMGNAATPEEDSQCSQVEAVLRAATEAPLEKGRNSSFVYCIQYR